MRLLLLLLVLLGCTQKLNFNYTATDSRANPTRPDGCEFEVLTTTPSRGFEEIGVLELDQRKSDASPSKVSHCRELVQHDVCAHGGEAVIAKANGLGLYIQGTVIRYVANSPTAAPVPGTPTER